MKEALQNMNTVFLKDFQNSSKSDRPVFLDTCFLIDVFEKEKQKKLEKFCSSHNVFLTSFNAEELVHNIHRIGEKAKEHIRKYLKTANISLLEISVSPGNQLHERAFVESVDSELLRHVHDPSDAVLVAAAILTKGTILTKDKHHLFTSTLENFLNKYNIKVFKEFKEAD